VLPPGQSTPVILGMQEQERRTSKYGKDQCGSRSRCYFRIQHNQWRRPDDIETRFNSLEIIVPVDSTKQAKLYGVVTNPTLIPGGKYSY
jgi:hypothetical protein